MKNLNDTIAKNCAEEYIRRTMNTETSNGGFSSFFVRIGEDLSHKPNTIFAENLPTSQLRITSRKEAKNIFYKECNTNQEYLLQVDFNPISKELTPEIICKPSSN